MTRTDALRGALVDQIMSWQPLSDAVAAAMRTVERHVFVPEVSLEEAYRDDTVVTRLDEDGIATSSASAPWLVGLMLDQGAGETVVAEGMFLSSEVHADNSAEDIERLRATTRAFQIRARRRTTPQGVFAAVADLEIDDLGTGPQVMSIRGQQSG